MIYIGTPLSDAEFVKVQDFLSRIKPLLMTNDCLFQQTGKNKIFDKQYPLRHADKVAILRQLLPEDCVKVEPNNNPRFEETDIFVFIKCVEIPVYGEISPHKLYIKIYLREQKNYDTVIVISFHEEGMHD